MNRTKFQYLTIDGRVEKDWSYEDFMLAMTQFKEGEIVLRERPRWGVDQMRKYLHGPATKFIISQFKDIGYVVSTQWVHNFIRDEFLDKTTKEVGGKIISVPVSSESIGRDRYIQWTRDINDWCIAAFGVGLPPAEKVE